MGLRYPNMISACQFLDRKTQKPVMVSGSESLGIGTAEEALQQIGNVRLQRGSGERLIEPLYHSHLLSRTDRTGEIPIRRHRLDIDVLLICLPNIIQNAIPDLHVSGPEGTTVHLN